jgi:hypothetical protein
MEFSKLIVSFAERFGITDLDSGEDAAMLEVDGMEITIAADNPGRAIVVAGVIGDPPPENAAAFAGMLLQANHDLLGAEGCGFAQNRETGAYVLVLRLAQDSLDLDAFCSALDAFVNKVENWRNLLSDFRPAAQAAGEAREADAGVGAASGLLGGGFMQV